MGKAGNATLATLSALAILALAMHGSDAQLQRGQVTLQALTNQLDSIDLKREEPSLLPPPTSVKHPCHPQERACLGWRHTPHSNDILSPPLPLLKSVRHRSTLSRPLLPPARAHAGMRTAPLSLRSRCSAATRGRDVQSHVEKKTL